MKSTLFRFMTAALSLIALPSFADFSIDYTGEKTKPKPVAESSGQTVSGKKLLLDNSISYAVVQGKCEADKIYGTGSAVELPNAMRMILPNGWRVFADEGAALDSVLLSWKEGDEWTKIISQAAEKYKIKAEINCAEKSLTFHPSPSRGIYFEKEQRAEFSDVQPAIVKQDEAAKPYAAATRVQPASPASLSLEPTDKETVNSYSERYAAALGYDRVAYKVSNISKVINGEIDPKGARKSKESFEFISALSKLKLYKAEGVDGVTGAKVLVITDSLNEENSAPLVFKVTKGFLSTNALELARVLGKSIGDTNFWPIDEDYKVPFSYDIVGTSGIDVFLELFKSFPVQAQFVAGQKEIYVVKRDTANRN